MCNHIDLVEGKCKITKENCPYVYFCNRTQSYRILSSMPLKCKIEENIECPKGFYKVCFERDGNLYVEINNEVKIIKNSFDYTPAYVKIRRLKNKELKIKEATE